MEWHNSNVFVILVSLLKQFETPNSKFHHNADRNFSFILFYVLVLFISTLCFGNRPVTRL